MHGLIAPAVDHRLKNDRYADVDGSVIGGHPAGYAEADAVCGAPYGDSSPDAPTPATFGIASSAPAPAPWSRDPQAA